MEYSLYITRENLTDGDNSVVTILLGNTRGSQDFSNRLTGH